MTGAGVVAHRASASKASFDALLESSAAWLEWIDGANKFEAALKDKIPWEDLDESERRVITGRLNSTSPESQLLMNSFYVTMVSGFEEYLRSTIRELVIRLSKTKPKYNDLDKEIRRINIRETASLLRRMDSPPDYFAFNETDLCRAIGTSVPDSREVELNVHAFAEVDSLIKLDSFIDRAKIFGKKCDWDYFGKQQPIKDAMKMGKENTRQVGKAVRDELAVVSRYRNRIAHTGGSAADVTVGIVKDHRILLKALANAIDVAG